MRARIRCPTAHTCQLPAPVTQQVHVVRGLRIGDGNSKMIINCHRPDNSAAAKNDIEPAEEAVYRWIWIVWVEPGCNGCHQTSLLGHNALRYGESNVEELRTTLW
jgi:hypothetical protein